jgi:hypothetical protein
MVQIAISQFLRPPGGLLDPAKLSTRIPTSSVTLFKKRVFSLATATKGKMYNAEKKNSVRKCEFSINHYINKKMNYLPFFFKSTTVFNISNSETRVLPDDVGAL